MQNFKSKDKAITVDVLLSAFKSVMNDSTQKALVENRRTGSVEISNNCSATVYKSGTDYLVEVFVTVDGLTRNVAHSDFDLYDL